MPQKALSVRRNHLQISSNGGREATRRSFLVTASRSLVDVPERLPKELLLGKSDRMEEHALPAGTISIDYDVEVTPDLGAGDFTVSRERRRVAGRPRRHIAEGLPAGVLG